MRNREKLRPEFSVGCDIIRILVKSYNDESRKFVIYEEVHLLVLNAQHPLPEVIVCTLSLELQKFRAEGTDSRSLSDQDSQLSFTEILGLPQTVTTSAGVALVLQDLVCAEMLM